MLEDRTARGVLARTALVLGPSLGERAAAESPMSQRRAPAAGAAGGGGGLVLRTREKTLGGASHNPALRLHY